MTIPIRAGEPNSSENLADCDYVQSATLIISDLARAVAFYRDVVGLSVLHEAIGSTMLGVGDRSLLTLEQGSGVSPVRERSRLGLFHTAFLLPDRASLGSFVRHLSRLGVPFGAADHDVSEAVYLVDPDGLTVEVYADRPQGEWRYSGDDLVITTEPLNLVSLAQASSNTWAGVPAQTRIGHLHFYIGDLPRARELYCDGLGMRLRTKAYPGALFIAAGTYHHHLGLNTWAKGAPPAGLGDARLKSWEFKVDATDIVRTAERMLHVGWAPMKDSSDYLFTDDWGLTVHLVTE